MIEYGPSRSAVASLVFAALLLASSLGAVAGTAAAAPPTEPADLAVDQPHYVNSDVDMRSDNGTQLYIFEGEAVDLKPLNFDPDNVVDYGTKGGNASLSFNPDFDEYTFEPDQKGTYEVFFIVQRSVSAGNNSSETTTERVRYTARLRADGRIGLSHQPKSAQADTKEDAANWRELNSTLKQKDLISANGIEPTVEEMVAWYDLRKHPQKALTGNIVGYIMIGVTSTAILVWVAFFGGHTLIIRKLRRRQHIYDAVESEEGTAKEAVAELDRRENEREPQNWDWQDIPGFDDHVAKAMRETFGTTVHDGTVEFLNATLPRHLIDDRLRAMGHDGWLAAITDDGVDFHHKDEVVDRGDVDGEVIDLDGASDDAIRRVRDALNSWDHPQLRAFKLPEADYDANKLSTEYDSMDLDTITEELQVDMRHFDNKEAFGEYLREVLESVEDSPFCDEQGRPNEVRYAMSHFLKLSQLLDDRFNWPAVRFHREAIERALIDFDPEQEARDVIEDVQMAGGD